jgi:hypothetical protein
VGLGDWLGTGRVAAHLKVYRPFKEARKFVRSLKLHNQKEWRSFSKTDKKPDDIPANPDVVYKDKEWVGYGDWLGTGNVANFLKVYRPFKEARDYARSLGLKSMSEWAAFTKGELARIRRKFPKDIPASPNQTYKDKGWVGNGDWLGTGNVAAHLKVYRPFKEARDFARGLGLKSVKEWQLFCRGKLPRIKQRLPEDISSSPNKTYKDKGWVGYGDWLDTGRVAAHLKVYRPFKEARDYARSLGLKSVEEWQMFCKGELLRIKQRLPEDIPAYPYRIYKDKGWLGSGDWLGKARK